MLGSLSTAKLRCGRTVDARNIRQQVLHILIFVRSKRTRYVRARSRDSWNKQLEGSSKYHAWTRIDTTGNLEEWRSFSYLVIAFNQLKHFLQQTKINKVTFLSISFSFAYCIWYSAHPDGVFFMLMHSLAIRELEKWQRKQKRKRHHKM